MSESSTYPLRLPRSIKAAVEKLAREEGISMNRFVATAVAEKLAVMNTAAYFAEHKGRADLKAFRRLLSRKGGRNTPYRRRAVARKRSPAGQSALGPIFRPTPADAHGLAFP